MQEKFLHLSKGVRFLIVCLLWLVTVVAFVGCLIIKHYVSIYWLEILLTCIGMFFSIVAICITIIHLTADTVKDN